MLPSSIAAKRPIAFTLLELLATVAIISVLAALLLPSVRSMVGKAQASQCAANLRAIGAGILSYTADENGNLPFGKDERTAAKIPWSSGGVIGKYVGFPDASDGKMVAAGRVFVCPSQPRGNSADGQNHGGYMANVYLMPILKTDTDSQVRLASVLFPAKTVLLSEGYSSSLVWKMDTWNQFVQGGSGGRLRHGPNPPNDVSKAKKGDAMNLLYVDGHVELWQLPRDPKDGDYMLWPRLSADPLMGTDRYALPQGSP